MCRGSFSESPAATKCAHGWHCGLWVASSVTGHEDLLGADRPGSLERGEARVAGNPSLVEAYLSVYVLMFLSLKAVGVQTLETSSERKECGLQAQLSCRSTGELADSIEWQQLSLKSTVHTMPCLVSSAPIQLSGVFDFGCKLQWGRCSWWLCKLAWGTMED